MITTLATYQDPLRLELAAQAEAHTDFEILCARADAGRTSPYWQFAPLTPMQQRNRALQEEAMCAGRLAKWGAV